MDGQLSDQIHDCFFVRFHLGAALLDGALDVALNGGLRTDEDRQVTVINNTGNTGRLALTANCAAEPSATHCVVEAVGTCGVSAPILLNRLPNCELVLTEGTVCVVLPLLSDGN